MAGKITDIPTSVTNAGKDIVYTSTTLETVTLVKSNATPTNRPRTAAIADTYIDAEIAAGRAKTVQVNNWNPREPLKIQDSLDDASEYSYARFTLDGKNWYAFITGNYLNKTASYFNLEIDKLTTFNATLGLSNVVRSHIGVAASQGDTYGNEYCLEPEPINVNSIENEYSSTSFNLLDPKNAAVAVLSTADLNVPAVQDHFNQYAGMSGFHWNDHITLNDIEAQTGSPWPNNPIIDRPAGGSVANPTAPSKFGDNFVDDILGDFNPFASDNPDFVYSDNYYPDGDTSLVAFTYVVPIVNDVTPSTIDGVTQAGGLYLFETIEVYQRWMETMRFFPWITDQIKATWLVPSGLWGVTGGTTVIPSENGYFVESMTAAIAVPVYIPAATTVVNNEISISNWRDNFLAANGASIYRKLVTSQFTELQLSDRNSRLSIKPELQNSTTATANIARAIIPSGGTYRARFTNTVLADEREYSVVGEIRTHISSQGSGMMGTLGASQNQFITNGWRTRADTTNDLFHKLYNEYSQMQTAIGAANVAYTQNVLSGITGGLLGGK